MGEKNEGFNRRIREAAGRGRHTIVSEPQHPDQSGRDEINRAIRAAAGRGEATAPTESPEEEIAARPSGDADGGARGGASPPEATTSERTNASLRAAAARARGIVSRDAAGFMVSRIDEGGDE